MEKISDKIMWEKKNCKSCYLCINFCPKKTLEFVDGKMTEKGQCIKCFTCERYCPDFAIEVVK